MTKKMRPGPKPNPTKNKGRLWDEEEVKKLIDLVEVYQIEQTWGTQNKIVLWKALAVQMRRSAKACQAKYSELRRKGVVYDYASDK